MTRRFDILLAACLTALLSACNVHEWPDAAALPEEEMSVDLVFDFTEITIYKEIIVTRADDGLLDDMEMRYLLRCYSVDDEGGYELLPDAQFVFLNSQLNDPLFRCSLRLTPGKYLIKVWADYVKSGSYDDLYYDTTDFSDVSIARAADDYVGSLEARDAFVGEQEVTVSPIPGEQQGQVSARIYMQRPFAKFKFVTTDIAEFVEKYLGITDPDEIAHIDFSDYRVLFRYTGYLPTHYNLFDEKPFDASTGYQFFSSISEPTASEATLGYDYVFVNGQEASVSVALGIYDKQGNLLSFSDPFEVPLKRNYLTVVSDKFLSQSGSGSVTIDTEYIGSYDIFVK